VKTSTFIETCGRKLGPIYIQFIRDNRLYGLEVGKAIRLLEKLATHEDASVRANASLLLQGIMQGRETIDQYPLISEFGRREQSPVIYIHDVIMAELYFTIKAASRAIGGRGD
jgi:hypothetical protein